MVAAAGNSSRVGLTHMQISCRHYKARAHTNNVSAATAPERHADAELRASAACQPHLWVRPSSLVCWSVETEMTVQFASTLHQKNG
jgi:hypothetical protein